MPQRKYMTTTPRTASTRIMTTEAEKKELVKAARAADLPLSSFIRIMALQAARRLTPALQKARRLTPTGKKKE
jgi:hypothetical protein